METKLRRIAEIARTKPSERFTSLVHLINTETLIQSHNDMKAGKASGIDNVTKYEYEADLKENIEDLVGRMKRNACKPQPARRYTYQNREATTKGH